MERRTIQCAGILLALACGVAGCATAEPAPVPTGTVGAGTVAAMPGGTTTRAPSREAPPRSKGVTSDAGSRYLTSGVAGALVVETAPHAPEGAVPPPAAPLASPDGSPAAASAVAPSAGPRPDASAGVAVPVVERAPAVALPPSGPLPTPPGMR